VRTHEWQAVVSSRSNVLIEGDGALTERFVRELIPHLQGPIVSFPDSGTTLDPEGVVLVSDVDRLDAPDQQALMVAIERGNGRLQIISTSTTPLFRRVENGDFLATLYYRLNTVWIELSPGGRAS
jgi:sigma-54-interacting transcriptional regulator